MARADGLLRGKFICFLQNDYFDGFLANSGTKGTGGNGGKTQGGLPLGNPQSVKKVEVQEALPPAGVIGAEPLTLVPQHFPRKPAQRCLRAITANSGFFDRLAGCPWATRSAFGRLNFSNRI